MHVTPVLPLSFWGFISRHAINSNGGERYRGQKPLSSKMPNENIDTSVIFRSHTQRHQTTAHIEPVILPRRASGATEAHAKPGYLSIEDRLKD